MAARLAIATFKPDGDMPSEFSAVSVDVVEEALDFTESMVGIAEWEDDASKIHALLASHYLKRMGYGANRATMEPTHSRSVGPVSEGASVILSKGVLNMTTYGQMYLMLFEARAPAFGTLAV